MTHDDMTKLVESIEASAEVILSDHEMHSEYLTDKERDWIVFTLKDAINKSPR